MNVLSKPKEPGEVATHPRVLSLLDLPCEVLEHLLEFLGFEAIKKLLNLKNSRLLAAIRHCKTRHYKYWTLDWINQERLKKLMNEVTIIKGVNISEHRDDDDGSKGSKSDEIVEALVNEREELESFEMVNSGCTDKALELLLSHPKMKVVGLSNSSVNGESLKVFSFSNISVMKTLDLSQCYHLTDDGVIAILNQVGRKLKILNLDDTGVSFSNIGSLTCTLPALEELNLAHCRSLTDSSIMGVLNEVGETLKILDLQWTDVSFSEIGSLTGTLPVLKELNLANCRNLTDASIIGVLNKVGGKLKGLHLTGTGVSFSKIGCLTSSLPALEILNLARCENLTDFGLVAFLNKAGKTLTVLNLQWTDVSLSVIGSLTGTLPVLKELKLDRCRNLTDSSIIGVLNKVGGKLKGLHLTGTKVSFSNIGSMSGSLPALEIINLARCDNLTDFGLVAFLNKAWKTLTVLNLRGTGVSFSEIGSLTSTLPSLEELNLEWCLNLTDSSIMELLNKVGEKLKALDLSKTKVSFSNIGSLSGSFPVLDVLNLKYCLSLKDEGLMTFLGKTSENLRLILSPICNVDVDAIQAAFPHIQMKENTF